MVVRHLVLSIGRRSSSDLQERWRLEMQPQWKAGPMKNKYVATLVLLTLGGSAYAEYGCQDGFIPIQQGTGQTCVADYNLPIWKRQNNSRDEPRQQAPRPVDRRTPSKSLWGPGNRPPAWGAIARSADGELYPVYGFTHYDLAEDAAIESCKTSVKERGIGGQCEVILKKAASYVAIVDGDGWRNFIGVRMEPKQAKEEALGHCVQKTRNCRVAILFSTHLGPMDPTKD